MKTYTIDDINNINPCYPPTKYLPEDWQGTLIDILQVDRCPPQDRIYVVVQLLDDKTNRLFAVWCAREALKLIKKPDPRSVEACNIAERYANGEATKEELNSARAADTADAAYAAEAARAAYARAAYAADAAYAAYAAAYDAAYATDDRQQQQIKQLIKMIKEKK